VQPLVQLLNQTRPGDELWSGGWNKEFCCKQGIWQFNILNKKLWVKIMYYFTRFNCKSIHLSKLLLII